MIAELASGAWRDLTTGHSRIQLKYTGDGLGGTFYVLRMPENTSFATAARVTSKHIPPNAKYIDAESTHGMLYLTYHFVPGLVAA